MELSGLMNPIQWLVRYLRGDYDDGGEHSLGVEKALTYAPLYYGVRRITNNFAMLPCNLMRKKNGKIDYKDQHSAYVALSVKPNGYQTPFVYKQQFLSHAILWGDGRSYIHREGPTPELIPLMPDRTITGMVDGEKWHACKPERDDRFDLLTDMRKHPEQVVMLKNNEVVHLPGFTLNGYSGISLVQLAKQSLGIGLGAEQQAAKQIKRGYAGGLMLEAPENAFRKEEDARQFLKDFRENHEGSENAGKVGLLRNGIKANILSMSNTDAQFLEQRKFQRQEAALWLGLESILGDDNSVSYNSLEQKILSYLMNCLGPWLTSIEQEFNLKLLTDRELNQGFRFKFQDGALLRSDKASLADFAQKMVASKIYNPNEVRYHYLDENPYEGGDVYENPATTSGRNQSQQQQQQTSNANFSALAVEATLKHHIGIEAKRVADAAKKENFLAKIEKFYAGWEGRFADRLEEIGYDRNLASQHCKASQDELIGIVKNSKPESLAANVQEAVSVWPHRSRLIIEGELANV